jgi:uncharacterized protein YuzE
MEEKIKRYNVTITPEELHQWYLEATKALNPESFNPNAQKPYDKLTEEQKFIDKFIANKVNQKIRGKKPKFWHSYDGEHGCFFVHEENIATDFCISFSDVIVDIGHDGRMVGFEILNSDKLDLCLEQIYENEKGETILKQLDVKTGKKREING